MLRLFFFILLNFSAQRIIVDANGENDQKIDSELYNKT